MLREAGAERVHCRLVVQSTRCTGGRERRWVKPERGQHGVLRHHGVDEEQRGARSGFRHARTVDRAVSDGNIGDPWNSVSKAGSETIVGRIIYLSMHPKNEISGGIKMHYRHVEMLERMGFDAWISVSGGHNEWFKSGVRVFNGQTAPDDIVVFPEVLNGGLGELSRMPARCAKVLLCQNQYYMFSETISKHPLAELNFRKHITVGRTARGYLERVFAPNKFDIVPVFVDPRIFRPGEKQARIAVIPRKLPNEYRIIKSIFLLKYPALRDIPWDVIEQKT
jgi:hypothetical protein